MEILLFFLSVFIAASFAQEEFYKKYAFTKVMSECLGGNIYYGYLQQVANARRECEVEGLFTHARMPVPGVFTNNPFGVPQQVPNFISTTIGPRPTTIGPRPTTIVPFPNSISPPFHNPNSISTPFQNPFSTPFPNSFTTPFPNSFTTPFPNTFTTARPGILTVNRGSPPFSGLDTGSSNIPVVTPSTDLHFGPRLPAFRQKRALVYSTEDIRDAQRRVQAMIGNFTCVLMKLGVVNSNLDINYDGLSQNAFNLPVDAGLKSDLVTSITYCRDLMSCLPLHTVQSPVPHQLQRLTKFVKCERDARFTACLKHDLRKNLNQFNINLLPGFNLGGDAAENLLSLIVGAESAYEMELI